MESSVVGALHCTLPKYRSALHSIHTTGSTEHWLNIRPVPGAAAFPCLNLTPRAPLLQRDEKTDKQIREAVKVFKKNNVPVGVIDVSGYSCLREQSWHMSQLQWGVRAQAQATTSVLAGPTVMCAGGVGLVSVGTIASPDDAECCQGALVQSLQLVA